MTRIWYAVVFRGPLDDGRLATRDDRYADAGEAYRRVERWIEGISGYAENASVQVNRHELSVQGTDARRMIVARLDEWRSSPEGWVHSAPPTENLSG